MHGPRAILSLGHSPKVLTHRHTMLSHAGYRVTSAAHPVKGINLLSSKKFDLVIIGVSEHSERVAIERLKLHSNVPVLFLCCDHFDPAQGACICAHAQIDSEELLKQIATALSKRKAN